MRIIRGLRIEGELVEIDGTHFIDCVLCECILEYGGGDVILERTLITQCHHVFHGRARRTVSYLESVGLMPPEGIEELSTQLVQ